MENENKKTPVQIIEDKIMKKIESPTTRDGAKSISEKIIGSIADLYPDNYSQELQKLKEDQEAQQALMEEIKQNITIAASNIIKSLESDDKDDLLLKKALEEFLNNPLEIENPEKKQSKNDHLSQLSEFAKRINKSSLVKQLSRQNSEIASESISEELTLETKEATTATTSKAETALEATTAKQTNSTQQSRATPPSSIRIRSTKEFDKSDSNHLAP